MRVKKLIYGPLSGWFKSESGKIMENGMTSYTPKFDRIVLQDFKTKAKRPQNSILCNRKVKEVFMLKFKNWKT